MQNVRFVYKNLRWLKFDRLCERSGAGQLMINEYLKFIAIKIAFDDRNSKMFNPPSKEVDGRMTRCGFYHICAGERYIFLIVVSWHVIVVESFA